MPSQRLLVQKNFPNFFRKLLGVLGLTKAISKIFRVVYAVREASLPQKKISPEIRLFFCGSQPPPARPDRRSGHHAEPHGSAYPHRGIVGWLGYATMAHSPTNLHQSPTITSESASHHSITQPPITGSCSSAHQLLR